MGEQPVLPTTETSSQPLYFIFYSSLSNKLVLLMTVLCAHTNQSLWAKEVTLEQKQSYTYSAAFYNEHNVGKNGKNLNFGEHIWSYCINYCFLSQVIMKCFGNNELGIFKFYLLNFNHQLSWWLINMLSHYYFALVLWNPMKITLFLSLWCHFMITGASV